MAQTVYAVTSFDRGGNSGYVVECIFTRREDAERFVAQDTNAGQTDWAAGLYEIEEFPLYTEWDSALDPYTYWHRGAAVYPDGRVDDWTVEHMTEGPGRMAEVDDHMEPWDGHTQGHCGLHISIFGCDLAAVEEAYERQVAAALGQVNGQCKCGRTGPFQTGFWGEIGTSRFVGRILDAETGAVLAEVPGWLTDDGSAVSCDYSAVDLPPGHYSYQSPHWLNEEDQPISGIGLTPPRRGEVASR